MKSEPEKLEQKKIERMRLRAELNPKIRKRDNYACHFCGRNVLKICSGAKSIHHKTPCRYGGEDSLENGITICKYCHDKLEILITVVEKVVLIHNKISGKEGIRKRERTKVLKALDDEIEHWKEEDKKFKEKHNKLMKGNPDDLFPAVIFLTRDWCGTKCSIKALKNIKQKIRGV